MTARETSEVLGTEQRLQLFIESVRDYAMYMLDPGGRVLTWNSGAAAIKGYRPADVLGKHVSVFYPPEDAAIGKPDRDLQKAMRDGRHEEQAIRVRADGSRFWAHVTLTAVFDPKGSLLGYGKVTQDISRQVEAEERLRRSEQQRENLIAAVLGTVASGIVTLDDSGAIQFANAAAASLFGLSPEALRGRGLRTLIAPADHTALEQHFRQSVKAEPGQVVPAQRFTGLRSDETTLSIELALGRAAGADPLFVAAFTDLTQRQQLEEELAHLRKLVQVGELSAGIAHDFNNLLTVIVGSAETLITRLDARPDLKRFADQVRTAGERGAELTQRLLAYSRRQPIQPIALDVNDVLGGLRQLLRRTLRENIEIAIALTEDVRTVFADPVQLELTILGLAVAAQEGMAGGGRLTITTADAAHEASGTRLTAPGERLIITIADDGTALPPAARQARIVAATAGLPAADVTVDVTPGAGTVVRLSLPAAGLAPSRQAPAEAAPESGRGLVLLAEDDPFVRSYAVTCLESLGFRVVAAVDGPDALARLSQGVEPDILFTDIVMPGGLNGWQLAEKALRVRPGLKVLYTSGYALDTLAEGGHIAPDTRVLNKPYRRAELARHMQELMQDARATA